MWEGKGWLLALLIAAVGFWLRFEDVAAYWVGADEGFYDLVAHAPFSAVRDSIVRSAHPPLFFWLPRATALISEEFVWLRVPSLIGGVAGILAM